VEAVFGELQSSHIFMLERIPGYSIQLRRRDLLTLLYPMRSGRAALALSRATNLTGAGGRIVGWMSLRPD
jgi:hypothetical protein